MKLGTVYLRVNVEGAESDGGPLRSWLSKGSQGRKSAQSPVSGDLSAVAPYPEVAELLPDGRRCGK